VVKDSNTHHLLSPESQLTSFVCAHAAPISYSLKDGDRAVVGTGAEEVLAKAKTEVRHSTEYPFLTLNFPVRA